MQIDDPEVSYQDWITASFTEQDIRLRYCFRVPPNPYSDNNESYQFTSFNFADKRLPARLNGGTFEYYDGSMHTIFTASNDTWYKLEFLVNLGSGTFDAYVNDSLQVTNANLYSVSSGGTNVLLCSGSNHKGRYYFDMVTIGKYVSNEPTFSTWGDEETSPETGSDWRYTSYTYDALGRVLTQTNTDNTTISHDYSNAWQEMVTNARGYRTRYYYDAFSRLVKVEELDAGHQLYAATEYTYDVLGNLVQVQDNDNNTTTMTYNWLSRKTAMTDPDMGTWTYGYDNNGNLNNQSSADNTTITFTYDALNRLTEKSYYVGFGMTDVTYTYDDTSGGNYGKGLRTGMTDELGTVSYTYDTRGRLVSDNRTADSVSYATRYYYDSADRLISVIYPTGENVLRHITGVGCPTPCPAAPQETWLTACRTTDLV